MADSVCQIIIVSSHGKPGLENLRCCLALGIFSGLVAHQAKDEMVRSRGDKLGSDRTGEEVRVRGDRVLKAIVAMVGQDLEIDISRVAVRPEVQLLEVIELHLVVVVVVSVSITSGSAGVTFVVIVGTIETQTSGQPASRTGGPTDRPRDTVSSRFQSLRAQLVYVFW
jgi:hypothetical protein